MGVDCSLISFNASRTVNHGVLISIFFFWGFIFSWRFILVVAMVLGDDFRLVVYYTGLGFFLRLVRHFRGC